ncbi:peptidoglycan DD-metalloendopeptidase family protein [Pedobacter lithocola]|uniref:Peptidoglycan DD-metalloendopeptidase family protein n=1 Tax=Pedobacter lithocola TaxID=1908239 RepID=A0ABV8PG20_9SPHI
MKSIFFIAFLLMLFTKVSAQQETQTSSATAGKFVTLYNDGRPSEIFDMFSQELQTAMPLEKAIAFLNGLASQAGKITNQKFQKYENSYAIYLTKFEKAEFLVKISTNASSKINGFSVEANKQKRLATIQRNLSSLILPFTGEWTVIWGGDTKTQNYHIESETQKNAFDFVITDDTGRSFKNDGKKNEDYYAFGKPIISPVAGTVVLVVNGVKDNIPGATNHFNAGGNTVIVKTSAGEYFVFCHLAHSTIKVREGDKIKQGRFIGKCGNSGHSSGPHLHFHIQDEENLDTAIGVKAFFKNISLNGTLRQDYSPVKNDKILQ